MECGSVSNFSDFSEPTTSSFQNSLTGSLVASSSQNSMTGGCGSGESDLTVVETEGSHGTDLTSGEASGSLLPKEGGVNKALRGGYTCCVPGCHNNNKKNRELSFHKFPKDKGTKKKMDKFNKEERFCPH